MKLIVIISLIVLVSMSAITAFATLLFSEDTRIRAEDQNLTLNELIAFQMETEIQSLSSSALSLLDMLAQERGNRTAEGAIADTYFRRNELMLYVGVLGSSAVYNEKFFLAGEIEKNVVDSFVGSHESQVSRARAGESLVINATPWLGVPSLCLLSPCTEEGKAGVLALLFSAENFQRIIDAKSVSLAYAVSYDGGVLVHPDAGLVKLGANLKDSKIVSTCMTSGQASMQFRFTDIDRTGYIGAFKKVSHGQFAVITTIPVSTVYSAALDVARQNLYITLIVLLFSILAIWFFSKTVSRPVMQLVAATQKIEEGNYDVDIVPTTNDELGLLTRSFVSMGKGLAEREHIKDTFGKFVNKEVASQALTGNLQLGGTRRTATIMFADIRSFTAFSERFDPESVVGFLNSYMTRMVDCIERTHGVVDKFIGDAIMAVWGAPVTKGDPAIDALECINTMIMMRKSLLEYNKTRGGPNRPVIRIGCGVNTGPCIAGQIGSSKRMEYTVIGDAVNLASRIEALNKPFGTDILISGHTFELVRDHVVVEPMSPITVKGKSDPLQIYAVINMVGAADGPQTLRELHDILGTRMHREDADIDKEEVKYEILEK